MAIFNSYVSLPDGTHTHRYIYIYPAPQREVPREPQEPPTWSHCAGGTDRYAGWSWRVMGNFELHIALQSKHV